MRSEHMGMSAYSWQYSVTTNDWITANPILEMRTALDQALGAPSGGYSAGLAQGLPIKAIHIQELRDRVLSAWSSTQINWLVADQLGTPRMVFDQSGSLATVSRHDYLPFGEELLANTGGRLTTTGYTNADGARQKFTQKERDNETGLDYFKARYYSSAQGRFTSADAPFADQRQTDPSSWNSYAYVRNNPCTRTDPNGRCSPPPGLKQGQVGICIEAFIAKKTFKTFGGGDNRPFSGNNDKLTSKFTTHIIAEGSPGNPKKYFDISQKTTPGTSRAVEPITGIPIPGLSATGTAKTRLNDQPSNSDGSSQITTGIGNDGTVRFNVATVAERLCPYESCRSWYH